ncbi:amino acid adenylation domain-containing protein [Streptomyces sp. BHT-5-2]|uniref:amino acid adenylation domain-containing protein n=1 Tax=Streptomyces sp. BHT-5-2 TaxID=2866715 RepID=UPI001C8EB08D|nr:amino acid adenylation domain-containing protein [Streptomyces sp. BHT-5-2]QZL04461.1 amino acid adenylation domain-containing protein [Streptomyces sp. BHT-5-2]
MGFGLIHQAVAHQARMTPGALAVVDGDIRLDYATLDTAADAWATALLASGAGPGTLIPVLLPRSARLYVALLAILKCGAGYAALDPRWPRERTDGVLAQLGAPVLVADAEELPEHWTVWRPPADLSARTCKGDSQAYVGPADVPASVFFTSGTSGTPKGVVSPHFATTRLFMADGPLDFGPSTVMLQAAPAAWDAFSLELWGPLTTGGSCVTAAEDYLLPDTLRRLIDAHAVDTAWLTASLFNLFTEIDADCFRGLRRLYIGGERLSTSHVGRFLGLHPGIRLFNGYGPVESCVFATVHPIAGPDCEAKYGVPIGRPVPGTGVHILDEEGHECPPDTVGELCISGAGLAQGYLGDPALTATRFQERLADATRLYRTGDHGFRDADGVFHFTGRADRQVKVRGYRIEPEEIEAHAGRLPGVSHCVAIPVPGELGNYDRLALFYTTSGEDRSPTDPALLRRSLGLRLPPHSVPDVVCRVDHLPVTANGKIDRLGLLATLAP